MKNKKELTDKKIKKVLDDVNRLHFPQLLRALRDAHLLNRRTVCKEIPYPEMRMFWLEQGCFRRPVPLEDLEKIAHFYGIEPIVLVQKQLDYFNLPNFNEFTSYKAKRPRKCA